MSERTWTPERACDLASYVGHLEGMLRGLCHHNLPENVKSSVNDVLSKEPQSWLEDVTLAANSIASLRAENEKLKAENRRIADCGAAFAYSCNNQTPEETTQGIDVRCRKCTIESEDRLAERVKVLEGLLVSSRAFVEWATDKVIGAGKLLRDISNALAGRGEA